jgi:hypothetical protein
LSLDNAMQPHHERQQEMQDCPETAPSAPADQQLKGRALARTSMVLGILSGGSILSFGCLLFIDTVGVAIPDSLAWLKWLIGVVLGAGFCLGWLAGLPAIITGHIARSRARRAPERYGGARFAKIGMVMGYAGILVSMLMLAAALPSLPLPRPKARKMACIANLKQIDAAKESWALEHKRTKGEPADEGQITAYLKNSARPICPAGGVYRYDVVGVPPTCSRGADLGHTL